MSALPEGWREAPIGEVAPKADAPTPGADEEVWNLSLEDVESHTGRVLNENRMLVSELGSTKCSFDDSHVLYSKLRPYLNKVIVPQKAGVGTSELIPLRPNPELLEREFLAWYLRSPKFLEFAAANTRGANLPRIAMRALWKHPLPVPPLDEQRRIVGRIREMMERVDEIRVLRERSIREATAVFHALLRERMDQVALTAEVVFLETCTQILGGQSLPKGLPHDEEERVLLLKVGDLNLEGNELEVRVSRQYGSRSSKGRVLPAGTLVFPKRGGAIATNKKRLLAREAMLDPNLMGVVPDPHQIRPRYLLAWFETINLTNLSNGGVIPQLNKKDLVALELPLPTVPEQDQFLEFATEARRAATALVSNAISGHEELPRVQMSILRKAFAGEL